ncbi:MAG TPA: oxidoreductase [Flavobacteriales bacterium]|nr:oxidoreductase [Flavobacteriales bacterium]
MLKIGVLGAGHLGKIHLKLLKQLSETYELVGFYDPSSEKSKKAEVQFGIRSFESVESLIDHVEVVDIVTPTLSHYECAEQAIRKQKHVFIEKPVTNTVQEGKKLLTLAEEAGIKAQVGHVERFNPAFVSAKDSIMNPMFIETHRLAEFNPRGTDVSVVLDLMIHDLDIVLSTVKAAVNKISASGVAVISETPDICNARIEFVNGCVANLTASRISMKNMRKTRIFQKNAYLAIDFLEKESEIIHLKDVEGEEDPYAIIFDPGEGKTKKQLFFNKPKAEPSNAILEELKSFAEAIEKDQTPIVPLEDGLKALSVAHQILEKIQSVTRLA